MMFSERDISIFEKAIKIQVILNRLALNLGPGDILPYYTKIVDSGIWLYDRRVRLEIFFKGESALDNLLNYLTEYYKDKKDPATNMWKEWTGGNDKVSPDEEGENEHI